MFLKKNHGICNRPKASVCCKQTNILHFRSEEIVPLPISSVIYLLKMFNITNLFTSCNYVTGSFGYTQNYIHISIYLSTIYFSIWPIFIQHSLQNWVTRNTYRARLATGTRSFKPPVSYHVRLYLSDCCVNELFLRFEFITLLFVLVVGKK